MTIEFKKSTVGITSIGLEKSRGVSEFGEQEKKVFVLIKDKLLKI